jgi:SOS-response transcriptional repressor LexA
MVGGFLDNRKLIYSTGHGHVYEERSMRGLSARQAQVLAFI